jgi:glycerol kinase
MILDRGGQVVSSSYLEHEQIYPQPGWVEHDAREIWDNTRQVVASALAQARAKVRAAISAVGITNQRETTLIWDRRTGRPLYNAVVWQCTRTQPLCQRLIDEGLEGLYRDKTGLPIATYFSGPKIRWLLDNVPGVRQAAEAGDALFGTMDTWLIWNLTGGPDGGAHVTDPTNASRTMLMNLRTLDWDDELLDILGIPRSMLPEIRPSSDASAYGYTLPGGPFGRAVPVCGDLGDQQAALFGQACYQVGEGKNTYGTGCFALLNTGAELVPSQSGLLTTVAYSLAPGRATYALEGSIAITGAAVQWLRDNLGLIQNAAETEAIAQSVEDTGGCYFVPAFSGLFAPYWDMYARGTIVGLTRYVHKAHLVRATLEAICYQTRDVMEAMQADASRTGAGIGLAALKVDGGAAVNNFLMQLQADILGVPVVRPTINETTALGAAYAAGLATGVWSGQDDLRANWGVDRTFEPAWSEERREAGYAGWAKAVARTRAWVDREP